MIIRCVVLFAWIGQVCLSIASAIALGGLLILTGPATQARAHNATPPQQPEMRFVVVRGSGPLCDPICPEWISAEGGIEGGTAKKFKKFLKTIGDRKLPVILQSPGGEVDSALAMARLIRERGLDIAVGRTIFARCEPREKGCPANEDGTYTGSATSIYAFCNSACPMMLAGGTRRLTGLTAFVGVHQVTSVIVKERVYYRTKTRIVKGKKVVTKEIVNRKRTGTETTTKMNKSLRKKLESFFREMGVDTAILEPIRDTPAADIRQLTSHELLAYNLITGSAGLETITGQQICSVMPRPLNCRQAPETPVVHIVRTKNCEPDCSEWISLSGDIDAQAVKLVRDAVAKVGHPTMIALASRGGDLKSALELGRFIREQGLSVSVNRTLTWDCRPELVECERPSAYQFRVGIIAPRIDRPICTGVCAYVLAGGVERFVPETVEIRLSHFSLLETGDRGRKKKKGADTRALLTAYLEEMGVSANILKFPPTPDYSGDIHISARGMRMMKLSTGQRPGE